MVVSCVRFSQTALTTSTPAAELCRVSLTIAAEEILRRQSNNQEKLSENLSRLGWAFAGGTLTSTGTFNPEDLVELPVASHKDLLKAVQRFRDGDL
jgi:hypothetical protein